MKHLLSAADLSRDEALQILDTAKQLSVATEQGVGKLPPLRGRTVVNSVSYTHLTLPTKRIV